MTVAVALVDPPREGLVFSELVSSTSLTPEAGASLYEAVLADFFATTAESNVDVLVNYPTPEMLPGDSTGSPEAEIRTVAASVLDGSDRTDLRFEVQVGSTRSARVGNAITHLLRDEEETSAAFVDHRVPLLERSLLDQAAIKLRRSETVLGPAPDGDVYFAGFTDPIDFTDVMDDGPLETIVSRSVDDGASVDFVEGREVLGIPRDLRSVVSSLRARRTAGMRVPTHTMAAIDEMGLRLAGNELVVENGGNR
ncbi:MAG: DUF2064 domain-containing protein [Halanaeroarchaeum sp.]